LTEWRDDVLSQPRCVAADEATTCSHDIIKNRVQSYTDRTLTMWLEDGNGAMDLEARLRRIATRMSDFSPAVAALHLRPLAVAPESFRSLLVARLDEVFEQAFAPTLRRERLEGLVDGFVLAVRRWREMDAEAVGARRAALHAIRQAAAALRRELELLPRGFWLPRGKAEQE